MPAPYELAVAAGLIALFTLVSLDRRRRIGWRRPPVSPWALTKALGALAFTGLFGYAAAQSFPMLNPHFLPWLLGLGGIGLFGFLQQLKLVAFSEAEFLEMGKPAVPSVDEAVNTPDGKPVWHRVVRGLYQVASYAVMLTFLAFMYVEGTAMREGSPQRTSAHSVARTDHGNVVYIAKDSAVLIDELQTATFIGIPAILVLGLVLHFTGISVLPGGVWVFGKRVS